MTRKLLETEGLHVDLVDEYVALAKAQGAAIVAVIETHVRADHVSGLPALVARTGATGYLPQGAGVDFEHHALADGEVLRQTSWPPDASRGWSPIPAQERAAKRCRGA